MRLPKVLKMLHVAAPLRAKAYRMLDGRVDPTADRQLIARAVGQVAFCDGYERALGDVERLSRHKPRALAKSKPTAKKRKSKR